MDFDHIWQKYLKDSGIEFAFIHCSSFKLDAKNNAKFDVVLSKRSNFNEVHFLIKTYTWVRNIWHA